MAGAAARRRRDRRRDRHHRGLSRLAGGGRAGPCGGGRGILPAGGPLLTRTRPRGEIAAALGLTALLLSAALAPDLLTVAARALRSALDSALGPSPWPRLALWLALLDAAILHVGLRPGPLKDLLGVLVLPLCCVALLLLLLHTATLSPVPLAGAIALLALGGVAGRRGSLPLLALGSLAGGRGPLPPRDAPRTLIPLLVLALALMDPGLRALLAPAVEALGAAEARWSREAGGLYGLQAGALAASPLLLSGGSRRGRTALFLLAALPGALPGGAWVSAGLAALGLGLGRARLREPVLGWPHGSLARFLARAAPLGLCAVSILAAWSLEGAGDCRVIAGARPLSQQAGAVDLAVLADGHTIAAALGGPQALLLLPGGSAGPRWISLRRPGDGVFHRTTPRSLLDAGGGRLFLLAATGTGDADRLIPVEDGIPQPVQVRPGTTAGDSADGVWLALDGGARVAELDPASGTVRRAIRWPGLEAGRLRVDRGRLWTVGRGGDRRLRRFNLRTGQPEASIPLPAGAPDLAISPASHRLYLPQPARGRIRVLDASSLDDVASFPVPRGARWVRPSPDGTWIAVGVPARGEVLILDAVGGERRGSARIGAPLSALQVGPGGRIVAASRCGIFEIPGWEVGR